MVTKTESRVNGFGKNSFNLWADMTWECKTDPLPITVPNYLIHYTGDASKALYLAQLMYWCDRATRPDGFIWKKKADWEKEIGIKKKSIERYEKEFVEAGFLIIKVHKADGGFPTNHYKLDWNKLKGCIIKTLWDKDMIVTDKTVGNRKRKQLETQ